MSWFSTLFTSPKKSANGKYDLNEIYQLYDTLMVNFCKMYMELKIDYTPEKEIELSIFLDVILNKCIGQKKLNPEIVNNLVDKIFYAYKLGYTKEVKKMGFNDFDDFFGQRYTYYSDEIKENIWGKSSPNVESIGYHFFSAPLVKEHSMEINILHNTSLKLYILSNLKMIAKFFNL